MIDLHVHSTCSDGSYTPSELVVYADKIGLTAFALTDHDTVAGISEATAKAQDYSVRVIPGIEISTIHNGKDIHMLGLNIDPYNEDFLACLEKLRRGREERNLEMIDALNNHGIPITKEALDVRFGDSIITRAHFAVWMVENGYASSENYVFRKYLSPGCSCYVPKKGISPAEAIPLIKRIGGGKAVLAHPMIYKYSNIELDHLVGSLAEQGLDGIEAIYSANHGSETMHTMNLAKKYHLFITGGSDFHGTVKPGLVLGTGYGHLNVPDQLLENLGL